MEQKQKKTSKPYSPEFRERAVRLAMEHRDDYRREAAALTAIAGIAPAAHVTVALIGFLLADPDLPRLIPVEYLAYYSTAVALANIYLRFIITGPLGSKT